MLVIKKLTPIFLCLLLACQTSLAQSLCSEVYQPQQQLYGASYIPYIQSKLGGHATRWFEMFSRINESNRSVEELILIDQIFSNTKARSWLARQANSFRFVKLESISKTLDNLYMREANLENYRSWDQLNVSQRRGLLLGVFKKWWWEVDSHQVLGFSRWTDVTYYLTRRVYDPIASNNLRGRVHEVLATSSQVPFLRSLFSRFRVEIKTLEAIKGQPGSRRLLLETLADRVDFLINAKASYGLIGVRGKLLDIQILRSAVLRRMVEVERVLRTNEIETIANNLGLDPSLAKQIKWGQVGLSLIPNASTFYNVAMDIAITGALAYVIGSYWLEDMEDADSYQGSFNEFFN